MRLATLQSAIKENTMEKVCKNCGAKYEIIEHDCPMRDKKEMVELSYERY